MRRCAHPHCGLLLPSDAHYNRRYCDRRCVTSHDYLRNRERRKAAARARYAANPEPVKARVRDYHFKHRARQLAVKRAREAMRKRRQEAGL